MQMKIFEALLSAHSGSVERFVKYRMPPEDADDVLQEIYITAYQKFETLKNHDSFKAWILSIAKSKCNDYFRAKAKRMEIPLDDLIERSFTYGKNGRTAASVVRDTLETLGDKDKQMLYLYFWKELPQAEIAKKLDIPLGTVKSRLHIAKENFKKAYPYPPKESKGASVMTKALPKSLPKYTITKSEKAPFDVKHEELPGMLIIPRIGEKLTFGMYDQPQNTLTGFYTLQVNTPVIIHGVEGVEIEKKYIEGTEIQDDRSIFAQLTDRFCRYLGAIKAEKNGAKKLMTFLDEDFSLAYGIGEDNCGFPVHRTAQGIITENQGALSANISGDVSDIVGRYSITINNKRYDTVRLIFMEDRILTEQYLDQNGRTILWRRFNRNDWGLERYGKPWTEKLPENERLTVNGAVFVHWYDCITDYIL